ncbi:MAG: precorrin-8X methylmutase [Deltaproteobacteria bacterium HGW-Deltaproteobacteria-15]|jgi:precorrin-8X/cobalt-precorrin-8 methylmutase|nr:MAG: precorrin-8X methylmutase [Deltaproteobacteria bacterium HGW-Deltaproteobacteria-15]
MKQETLVTMKPAEIESRSFAIIESEIPEPRPFKGHEWLVVRRMIHTSADFELLTLTHFHPEAVSRGVEALSRGCLIITDTEMARVGITQNRLSRLGSSVECYINHPEVIEKARKESATRSASAVDYALEKLNGNICAIGNAPTSLLRLLYWMGKGRCNPALIVGMPVGFVNARESKEALMLQKQAPFITIRGRKGGSTLAATVVNQLAEIALGKK